MNTSKLTILVYTRYNSGLDGGVIRHNQIKHALASAGYEVIINPGFKPRFRNQIFISVLTVFQIFIFGSFLFKKLFYRSLNCGGWFNLLLVGRAYFAARKAIKSMRPVAVVVEDVIFGGQGVVLAAKELLVPIITMPHNIDSFSGFDINTKAKMINLEMGALKLGNLCFSISANDTWLHRQFGIDSHVFSYYPSPERKEYLLSIRKARSLNTLKTRRFLISGNAHNILTKEGLMELLEGLVAYASNQEVIFDIVGRDTESLGKKDWPANMIFHGSVDTETFSTMATQCSVCIAYQKQGSGALTRVFEMLMAGIPVLGNNIALRGWGYLEGAYLFNDWSELYNYLSSPPACPLVPLRLDNEYLRLTNLINEII